jgi:hypothetical protein
MPGLGCHRPPGPNRPWHGSKGLGRRRFGLQLVHPDQSSDEAPATDRPRTRIAHQTRGHVADASGASGAASSRNALRTVQAVVLAGQLRPSRQLWLPGGLTAQLTSGQRHAAQRRHRPGRQPERHRRAAARHRVGQHVGWLRLHLDRLRPPAPVRSNDLAVCAASVPGRTPGGPARGVGPVPAGPCDCRPSPN